MKYLLPLCLATAFFCSSAEAATIASATSPELTLEKIMADPDWIGPPVKDAFWSVDGRAVYYSLKRSGTPLSDMHRITLSDHKDKALEPSEQAAADAPAVYDRAGKRAAFARNGDIFVRGLPSGRARQITRTPQIEADPQFSSDGRLLSFHVGNDWFVHEFGSGLTRPVAVVRAEKDPNAASKSDDLRDVQLRTFSTLKRLHDDSEAAKRRAEELRKADATRAEAAFYLGDDVVIRATSLSPDARWLLVVTAQKSAVRGMEGKLTRYVTESGYEEFETERLRVGRNPPAPQSLLLLNLTDHSMHPLPVDALTGISDDPLKAIRDENAKAEAKAKANAKAGAEAETEAQPATPESPPADNAAKRRGVWITTDEPDGGGGGAVWSGNGESLAIQLLSIDNKDRWIVSVDFSKYVVVLQHRLTDAAWINSSYNEFGWLNDDRTLWFASEESGYNQLYTKLPNAPPRALTHGKFEVSEPALSPDGRWFYLQSNAAAPYSYDVYRVPSDGGAMARISRLEGVEHFSLAPSGKQLLLVHSAPYVRSQIALLNADGSGAARDLTDTRSADYKALSWISPEIVAVPSTHFKGVIYAKVYRASADSAAKHPAVVFVHGAGYLQDVQLRSSYYFREQMFNNLLVQHGYTVIDLDYRASQGYGRDWRTAIYRQMGYPELEDILDGKKWLVEQAGVDGNRVGIYGGSYGGFMTLMALFRAPGEFAAGAALRPVTDWMQYDHNYTTAILNDPQIDPIAYQRSSPIEFASALRDPLLICHGVIDDNVLFEDSMRLYQRLIELHKDNFEISPYPLDRHGFTNADSWLDEYKRIYRLFEAHLE
jgi:dipeptidyl aminopeptidase/acylaminoacyl peptidase